MLCGCGLHLRQVRVLAVVSDTPGVLVVEVESTVGRPRCPQVRHRRPPRPCPPCAGPLLCHQVVLSGAHRGAPRHPSAASPQASSPSLSPRCSEPRFALLPRGDTFTEADRARLEELFDAHSRVAYSSVGQWRHPLCGGGLGEAGAVPRTPPAVRSDACPGSAPPGLPQCR